MINISIPTNILIIISCLILFLIIGLIVYIIYKDKKIDQAEIDDLLDDIVKAKPRKDVVQVKKIEQDPVRDVPSKINLEDMLEKMQQNLEKKEEKTIQNYEQDQEENAIISYRELLKANDKMSATQNYEEEQEKNAIISFKELKNTSSKFDEMEELVKPKKIAKIESPREEKDKKFKNTDFISPIYGKMDNKTEYPKIKAYDQEEDLNFDNYFGKKVKYYDNIEDILATDGISDELRKNDEFLKALKEFRNNL